MNRKKKLLLNTVTGIAKQIVTVICGFILPRFILLYYGSEINGLISSISHFLSFISLLDLGVGSVIQANLYKPLADKDIYKVSAIVVSSQRFFRRLAYIFLVYIVILAVALPNTVSVEQDFLFTSSLVMIIAISTFAQFFFGMTNELLLAADQRSYITISMQIGTVLLNTLCCIILMEIGASIHAVKLLTSAI
ncbi:MAG: sugar isomerase, partial [Lachnospiraceae bacterium]|nr:sugar isomerase [Lachnospiraceae bacterium]